MQDTAASMASQEDLFPAGSVKTRWPFTEVNGPSGGHLCKKPRPLRFFRGTCFQWVQSKRTGCPLWWMDLLAAIFARNRGLVKGTCFHTSRQKVYTQLSWIERPMAAKARHPSGPVFTLSAQKSVSMQWLFGFSYFSEQKSIPRWDKPQKYCVLSR